MTMYRRLQELYIIRALSVYIQVRRQTETVFKSEQTTLVSNQPSTWSDVRQTSDRLLTNFRKLWMCFRDTGP